MKVFDLQGKNTNFVSEMLAGLTSFVTMGYLLVQCPAMLGGDNVAQSTVYIAMCITCFLGCAVMGLWANQPFVVGPSVGLTAYFAATLMTDLKYDYTEALAISFFAGVIYVALALTGLGGKIFSSLSGSMKSGISAGLGLYIALIGFKNAGFLSGGDGGIWKIADLSTFNLKTFTILVMFAGLVCIGIFKKIGLPFPPLLGLLASGAMYYGGGIALKLVDRASLKPNFGSFNQNFGTWYNEGFLRNMTSGMGTLFGGMKFDVKSVLVLVITILVCALFNATESVGVTYAIAKNNGMLDENGNFGALKKTLGSNAAITTAGTLFGCPMVSVAPESTAGICAQGKSGLTAVTAGVLFLLAAFFAPVATYISPVVTACVMVYIGFTMLGAVKDIDCSDIGEGVPALLTILLIPITSSIIDGIALGIILHIVVNIFLIKIKAIKPVELIIALLFGAQYFYI